MERRLLSGQSKSRADSRNQASGKQRRACTKLIRLSFEELQLVTERARAGRRPVACYIHESSLGPSPRARRTDLTESLVRALARVATRLTPLAIVAKKEQLSGAVEFETAISDLLAVIRDLD